MTVVSPSDALILVSESILSSIDELNRLEFQKKGRKYRFVDNSFRRIREEERHLVICPEDLQMHASIASSYFILSNIDDGAILNRFPDLCLAIVGFASELERNGWYEEINSSVVHLKDAKFNPMATSLEAIEFFNRVQPKHISMGVDLMISSKLNFIHTDHHVGAKLEGQYLRFFVEKYFGEEALLSNEVLVALKSFVHWGNIKGILYKLEVPSVEISLQLQEQFNSFPEPSNELKRAVFDRYPSGTSKYSLLKRAIDTLGEWTYAELIPYPKGNEFDLNWLYELCDDIENNPIKYHLRSSAKNLCKTPVNLAELSTLYSSNVNKLLHLIALIINIFDNTGGEFLLQNSKIPKFEDDLINQNIDYYNDLVAIKEKIYKYEEKQWDHDDIVLRLRNDDIHMNSLYEKVHAMRQIYNDDLE
ncbi:uncharacterized protein PRCAT00003337001 [Priceomyces carsonii]|uniref:uncharacterized protein n=1 Tax=Priceomyces carsonii TaxID=28549 RepID=UPI002ED7D4EE|nr:unnamed protein product [Priceomyces carsonii]